MRPVMTYWNYVRRLICSKCKNELTRIDWVYCAWCGEEMDWYWNRITEENNDGKENGTKEL